MIKSDFKNSILNLSATLAEFTGIYCDIPKFTELQNKLKSAPKNVIFIIFDGLGIYNIDKLSKENDFYKKHITKTILSTIPATTTNATTAMLSTKYPDQHLWLAWSLWLKAQHRVSEIYLSKDYYTHEKILPYTGGDITAFIDKAKTDRQLYAIAPSYVKNFKIVEKFDAGSIEELFVNLSTISRNDGEKFIYAYCDEPDHTMHEFGIESEQVKQKFEEIQTRLESYLKNNKDTLIITTADHGHVDISKYINIYENKEIMELLERPMSMENRFVSFKVKAGKREEFKKIYNEQYKNDLDLYAAEELIDLGIFGNGNSNEKIKEFLGDFVAIGNNTFKAFSFYEDLSPLKGNHAGYTKEEMEVPLCIFESK